MFRRQYRHNVRAIRFCSQIDHYMPEIRLLAAADRAIRHEDETIPRRDSPHEPIAINPRIHTLLERQIHSRRAHLDIEKESLGSVKGLE